MYCYLELGKQSVVYLVHQLLQLIVIMSYSQKTVTVEHHIIITLLIDESPAMSSDRVPEIPYTQRKVVEYSITELKLMVCINPP